MTEIEAEEQSETNTEIDFAEKTVIQTYNGFVATTPFSETHVKMKISQGFATVEQRGTLHELEVLFDTEDYKFSKGDKVYLTGDAMKHTYATQRILLGDKVCILVPVEQIVAAEKKNKDFQW